MAALDTTQPLTSQRCRELIRALGETYDFVRWEVLTYTAFQRPVDALVIGNGPRRVLFTAAHHANEWLTGYILLQFCQDLAQAILEGGSLMGISARALQEAVTIYMVPMVDPDGVDLVTGAIGPGQQQYTYAQRIAQDYPAIPFPDGWKANLLGVDLNLNYPARWLQAREIKFRQGFISPAPRDYVGRAPLDQAETQALAGYTEVVDPALVLAFHSQGKEIYWQFGGIPVEGARELGEIFARLSGYTLTDPPENSANAGYKDWFIQEFRRPGYTIEVGRGVNPLPVSQFPEIYRDNLGILLAAALGYDPESPTGNEE